MYANIHFTHADSSCWPRLAWALRWRTAVALADILGNAYLSLYFNTGQNPKISQQALSAYAQAVSTWDPQGRRRGSDGIRSP